MKFLPIRDLELTNRHLNFETPDCRVEGGCDIYTTKAAGVDKKLYKAIEKDLETRWEADLRLSASLSPPHDSSALLSRSSPFGPLDQPASRRTFAYLIATLNASHPDYDFSGILRPTDFRRERSLKAALTAFNTTLFNLARPVPPGLWEAVDREMSLNDCLIYYYVPRDGDIFDDENSDEDGNQGGVIWSLNYFFYNRARKRVCYLYLRGVSTMGESWRGSMAAFTQDEDFEVSMGRRGDGSSSGGERESSKRRNRSDSLMDGEWEWEGIEYLDADDELMDQMEF